MNTRSFAWLIAGGSPLVAMEAHAQESLPTHVALGVAISIVALLGVLAVGYTLFRLLLKMHRSRWAAATFWAANVVSITYIRWQGDLSPAEESTLFFWTWFLVILGAAATYRYLRPQGGWQFGASGNKATPHDYPEFWKEKSILGAETYSDPMEGAFSPDYMDWMSSKHD